MANKPLQDLGMPSPNRIAAVLTCVELDREQSYSTSDLLSYVQNNIDVHEINNIVLTKIRDQAVLYKSVDTVLEPNEAVNYPSEF